MICTPLLMQASAALTLLSRTRSPPAILMSRLVDVIAASPMTVRMRVSIRTVSIAMPSSRFSNGLGSVCPGLGTVFRLSPGNALRLRRVAETDDSGQRPPTYARSRRDHLIFRRHGRTAGKGGVAPRVVRHVRGGRRNRPSHHRDPDLPDGGGCGIDRRGPRRHRAWPCRIRSGPVGAGPIVGDEVQAVARIGPT